MTRGKISAGRRWMHRLFAGWSGPEEVDDVVVLTTPWEGTGRYTDLQYYSGAAAATLLIQSPIVPDNSQWWVPYCSFHHTDPALTAHAFLQIRDRANQDVVVVGGADVTANRHLSIRRPLIVPEGGRLRANLSTVTAGGTDLKIAFFYVEMPLGEFVPAI